MIQASELQKDTSQNEATVNSEEIKPVSIDITELCLSKRQTDRQTDRQPASQPASQFKPHPIV